MNLIGGTFPAYCSMEQRKFVTFDRSMYTYQLSHNWHVLAKDCSGRSRFVILTRNITSRTVSRSINLISEMF
jgi:von Willebrand factor type D domain